MEELEKLFDLDFTDKELLKRALTHSSYANENNTKSNERLEYVGDAVLDLLMGEYLFTKYPNYQITPQIISQVNQFRNYSNQTKSSMRRH